MNETRLIFERQWLHAAAIAILLLALLQAGRLPRMWDGAALGITTHLWVMLAVGNAIAHEVYVWFAWRTELHLSWWTRWFGRAAFGVFATGFAALWVLRGVLVTIVSLANRDTLPLHPVAGAVISAVLFVPVAYLGYSIRRYFGFLNAFGRDHFDPALRRRGYVSGGIFKHMKNPMYAVGFLGLWIPPLLLGSTAGVVVALFSHLYIWVHYYCTELPDLKHMYGSRD